MRFPGGLVFKAHRLLYHSTLDLRVIKKKKKMGMMGGMQHGSMMGAMQPSPGSAPPKLKSRFLISQSAVFLISQSAVFMINRGQPFL